jgi:hypothetical protein
MRGDLKKTSVLLPVIVLAASTVFADSIKNWPAPTTWSPAKSLSGLTAMDVTNPLPFIGLAPCRIVDTRGNGAPIQGGIFTGGSDVRSYALAGICGIPASARAVSLNFTVTGPGQTAPGFLTAWPTGGAVPIPSILNWDHVPAQVANAAVVPTSASTSITVNVSAPTHVIVDVNGYYYDGPSPLISGERFTLLGDVIGGGTGLLSIHNTESVSGARAGYFVADSSGFGSTGIGAFETATSGLTAGVYGQANSSTGDTAGVSGVATSTTGRVYGLRGQTSANGAGAAGVYGVDGSGDPNPSEFGAGVRGASTNGDAVLGVAGRGGNGVTGVSLNTSGQVQSVGTLAQNSVYGVFSDGNFGATGTKMFIEPHPSDASKVIRYVSLEGPESGTYFRGTTRTVHGETTIDVPESFRIVTDEEGLTVQLTPVGALATLAVISQDLDRIVVRSSKDVTFHYLAQGVRRAFKDHQAIADGPEFRPASATERMPLYLTEEAKRRLIANGTYNPDGTVNMETAERLGWTKAWKDREEQAKAAAAANAAARAARLTETK